MSSGHKDVKLYNFNELENSGLLWLINRTVFHPRGFTFGLVPDANGNMVGWAVVGDGKKCQKFDTEVDEIGFLTAETFLTKLRGWYI